MQLNIRLSDGNLESVKAKMVDFEPFKMFSHKDSFGYYHVCEYSTGMRLGDGYHDKLEDATKQAIEGYYGGDYWEGRLAERIEYINEKMLKPNLEKYGYANK